MLKQPHTIEVDDAALAYSLVEENHEITTPNNAGIFVRSAFFPSQSYQGTLYRLDEHCYYKTTTGDLAEIRIINIFAWNIYGVYYVCERKKIQVLQSTC